MMKLATLRRTVLLYFVAAQVVVAEANAQQSPKQPDAREPIALKKGPHLLLDEHLIARSVGVERKVVPPQRFLAEPIVTGALEHQNWQPFFTVLHDPAAPSRKLFRMWYNVDVVDNPADGEWYGATGYLESSDGIRWPAWSAVARHRPPFNWNRDPQRPRSAATQTVSIRSVFLAIKVHIPNEWRAASSRSTPGLVRPLAVTFRVTAADRLVEVVSVHCRLVFQSSSCSRRISRATSK